MLRRPSWPLVAVWLCTLGVFLPALRGEYVDDDLDLLAASPTFAGIEHLWDAVRAPFWGTELGYWRPLTSGVMCVGHAVGDGHPWPTHAFALLTHLLATTLAYAILRRLDVGVTLAALAAAVFALHPCQVESLAWVAAFGDPLAGCATLLALWGWIGWRARGDRGLPWLAWLGVLLALAAKESGLAALGWIAAAELAARRRWPPLRWGAAAVGFVAIVALWLGLRMLVFGDMRAGFDRGRFDLAAHGAHAVLLRAYLATAFSVLPTGWLGFTPYRWIPPDVEGLARALWPLLGLAALGFASVVAAARVRRDLALLGILGAAIAVGPALLAPANLGPWPLVDRYVYTAMFGVATVLVGCGRCRVPLALALAIACTGVSISLLPRWRTHEAVVARALADCPQHPEPHYLRGSQERLRAERLVPAPNNDAPRQAHYRAAYAAYRRAVELAGRPLYAGAHLRAVLGLNAELGAALAAIAGRLRPLSDTRGDLAALAARHPGSAQVQLAVGVAAHAAGDMAGAESAWQRALQLEPTSPHAAFNLAQLYTQLGRHTEAQAMLERTHPPP